MECPWHHLDRDAVTELLRCDPARGLAPDEVEARQRQFGMNVLTGRRGPTPLVRFLLQFHAPLVYVLLIAALATALLREWADTAVIVGVVLVNAAIGFLQESKALHAIESLARRMATEASVIRDGEIARVPAATLVPGDVVLHRSGDRVPADVRVLEARELHVDESALTGESIPVTKSTPPLAEDVPLPDRTNLAYASTFVTYGRARAIVVATGNQTEIGRISRLLEHVSPLATPLTRKIGDFSRVLVVILVVAAAVFMAGLARDEQPLDMFMAAVALSVAAIPEGLPAAVTIILAIGVARMARQNALIRRLPAVETLGSTTVICSDKTGTLTRNEMTVQAIATVEGRYEVSGAGYTPDGEIHADAHASSAKTSITLRECLIAGLLCNDALVASDGSGGWSLSGDPTEGALLVAARKAGFDESLRVWFRRLDTIPFESERQYMATLHDRCGGAAREAGRVAYVKGSLERVLDACANALDEHVSLDRAQIERAGERMAADALRVIALARATLPPDTTSIDRQHVESGQTFLGLQGMIDPPRADAIAAVAACRDAGIEVKMITGDHATTAAAVAAQIGLGSGSPRVVTGRELGGMNDDALAMLLPRVDVFARVAPEHKLRIVTALQAAGHVVAMTGDGVNDAPALLL